MNPPTDAGKKDLPPALRSRFTELYVDELEDAADLRLLASRYRLRAFDSKGQLLITPILWF